MYVKSEENSNNKNNKKNQVLSCVKNQEAVFCVLEVRAHIAHGFNTFLNASRKHISYWFRTMRLKCKHSEMKYSKPYVPFALSH